MTIKIKLMKYIANFKKYYGILNLETDLEPELHFKLIQIT